MGHQVGLRSRRPAWRLVAELLAGLVLERQVERRVDRSEPSLLTVVTWRLTAESIDLRRNEVEQHAAVDVSTERQGGTAWVSELIALAYIGYLVEVFMPV